MGLFDSVYIECKYCGEEVEFQSKAGECDMSQFTSQNVPLAIVIDLDGSSVFCKNCNEVITVEMHGHVYLTVK